MNTCKTTGFAAVIEAEHALLHRGIVFSYTDIFSLGNGATQNYIFTTPPTPILSAPTNPITGLHTLQSVVHLGVMLDSIGDVTLEIFEGSDRTGTTLQTAFNRNRNSTITPISTIYKDYTVGTTDGTKIEQSRSGNKSSSGEAGSGEELMLKVGTQYTIRVTSNIASNYVSLKIQRYELIAR